MKVKVTKIPSLFKQGGGIHIKPSHEGLFTLKANRHGMGVLLFASHVLANKEDYPTSTIRLANFARNASKWNAFGGNLLYADGGLFEGSHTHGVDFRSPGDFTEFNAGSSHELNGNEGVLQGTDNNGTPNLVEQGETKWNDYIFSTRLTIPTRKELDKELKELPENEGGDSQRGWEISILKKWAGKTYAYASKHAFKEAEERPNDSYSNETLDELLTVLKNSQEKLRAIEESKKEAKEEQELLKEMSDKDYNDAKELQEALEQAAIEQALLQQVQAELLALMQQQMLQMSPEELQAYIQLQLLMQPQGMACGGKLHAEGGELSPEDELALQQLIASTYYQYLLLKQDNAKLKTIQANMLQYIQLIQLLPLSELEAAILLAQFKCLYDAATQDEEFLSLLLLNQLLYAEGGEVNDEYEKSGTYYDKNTKTIHYLKAKNHNSFKGSGAKRHFNIGDLSKHKTFNEAFDAARDILKSKGVDENNGIFLYGNNLYHTMKTSNAVRENDNRRVGNSTSRINLLEGVYAHEPAVLPGSIQTTFAPTYNLDTDTRVNIGNIRAEGGDIDTSVTDTPLVEEIPHDELTGVNPTQDVEEMSTSLLNETIDLIYQWAKLNDNKELARRARKVKKQSREDKEDFVDEALDEVELIRTLQQELQRLEEQQAQELMTLEALMLQELLMSLDALSEALAALELNALMQPLLFAKGGNLFRLGGKYDIQAYLKAITDAIEAGDYEESETEGFIPSKPNSRTDAEAIETEEFKTFWKELIKPENWNSPEGIQIREKLAWATSVPDYKTITPEYAYRQATTGNKGYYHTPITLLPDSNNNVKDGVIDDSTPVVTTDNKGNKNIVYVKRGLTDVNTGKPYGSYTIPKSSTLDEELGEEITGYDERKTIPGFYYDKDRSRTVDGTLYVVFSPILNTDTYYYKDAQGNEVPIDESTLEEYRNKGYFESAKPIVSEVKDGKTTTKHILSLPVGNAPIPKYRGIGDKVALGLTAGTTLYNILSPTDTTASELMFKIAPQIGSYSTVTPEFLGDYVAPRRFDRNYWATKAYANNAAQLHNIYNTSAGNRAMANALTLAANLNYLNSLGELARQGEMFNAEQAMKEAAFNRGTNQYNAEAALKAAMANQDAYSRALSRFGDFYAKGISFGLAARDAKERAISQGMSQVASGILALELNKWLNDLLGWRGLYVNPIGGQYEGYEYYDPLTGKIVNTKK